MILDWEPEYEDDYYIGTGISTLDEVFVDIHLSLKLLPQKPISESSPIKYK